MKLTSILDNTPSCNSSSRRRDSKFFSCGLNYSSTYTARRFRVSFLKRILRRRFLLRDRSEKPAVGRSVKYRKLLIPPTLREGSLSNRIMIWHLRAYERQLVRRVLSRVSSRVLSRVFNGYENCLGWKAKGLHRAKGQDVWQEGWTERFYPFCPLTSLQAVTCQTVRPRWLSWEYKQRADDRAAKASIMSLLTPCFCSLLLRLLDSTPSVTFRPDRTLFLDSTSCSSWSFSPFLRPTLCPLPSAVSLFSIFSLHSFCFARTFARFVVRPSSSSSPLLSVSRSRLSFFGHDPSYSDPCSLAPQSKVLCAVGMRTSARS